MACSRSRRARAAPSSPLGAASGGAGLTFNGQVYNLVYDMAGVESMSSWAGNFARWRVR